MGCEADGAASTEADEDVVAVVAAVVAAVAVVAETIRRWDAAAASEEVVEDNCSVRRKDWNYDDLTRWNSR